MILSLSVKWVSDLPLPEPILWIGRQRGENRKVARTCPLSLHVVLVVGIRHFKLPCQLAKQKEPERDPE